jgi:hypothetical protein
LIGVGTAITAPPSEPDRRISRIRLSSWWFTCYRIEAPQHGLIWSDLSSRHPKLFKKYIKKLQQQSLWEMWESRRLFQVPEGIRAFQRISSGTAFSTGFVSYLILSMENEKENRGRQ